MITSSPEKNILYERWLFRNARQTYDETTSAFIVRVRKLAATCEYDSNEEEIRDQFVKLGT